jgi:hypothetical protein
MIVKVTPELLRALSTAMAGEVVKLKVKDPALSRAYTQFVGSSAYLAEKRPDADIEIHMEDGPVEIFLNSDYGHEVDPEPDDADEDIGPEDEEEDPDEERDTR